MRTKKKSLLVVVVFVLFSFSCFCISRMAQSRNQLINCRNHILGFKESLLSLKNRSEKNTRDIMKALIQMKLEITQRGNLSEILDEKKVDILSRNQIISDRFEAFKFFFPHLRNMGKIYPDVIISKGKSGASFALGIPTMRRGNHTYLKQTLASVIYRMTPTEEKDSVVIVSVSDNNEDYLNYVVGMIKTTFKRQVKSGSLEVISVPTFLYQTLLQGKQMAYESDQIDSWKIKQVLDFCILMLYAQPKARYYLQLEDDIIAEKMYFTKMSKFVNSIIPNDWLLIEFSILGFIGNLFRSEDLSEFVHFFLMFYQEKPIGLLLHDI
uniref:MGAT4 family, member C n=1 Tax=Jaculus jaculus TaxID=51337 RepID=A0A8C5K3S1_JACJA